jgi:nucleoside 2-deoxyribosyltransferase
MDFVNGIQRDPGTREHASQVRLGDYWKNMLTGKPYIQERPMRIYIIGSLREPTVTAAAERLRADGFEVFDDWHGAGPAADDEWQRYEKGRGRTYSEALDGYNAEHVFSFDKKHLDRCDAAVLVCPAGRSAHLELGYMIGTGKLGYVLFDQEPERWDVMYRFATKVFFNVDRLSEALQRRVRVEGIFGPKVAP